MKQKFPFSVALPLALVGFLALVAHQQLTELWRGQTSTSPTDVSLTVIASASSSSASSTSSVASSAASSASSTGGASSSSEQSSPYGRYRYSEELTMEKLIPLLRRRFVRPAAPVPPEIAPLPPYYRPLRTFPRTRSSLERDLFEFGERIRAESSNIFLWPFAIPETPAPDTLHFLPWGPFDAWQWRSPVVDLPLSGQHAAAGEPRWLWVRSLSEALGPRAEAWLWIAFFVGLIVLMLFSRRITDHTVDLLVWIKRKHEGDFAVYEGPPIRRGVVTKAKN